MLLTENRENGIDALNAFKRSDQYLDHVSFNCGCDLDWNFEHGQLWISCPCGALWSVNDSNYGFCFEQVSEGDCE